MLYSVDMIVKMLITNPWITWAACTSLSLNYMEIWTIKFFLEVILDDHILITFGKAAQKYYRKENHVRHLYEPFSVNRPQLNDSTNVKI